MREYFPKPKSLGANVKVELDLSHYATKADLKNVTGVDTSDFAQKTDLANLKSDVDKLDTDKLKNVPSNVRNSKSKVDKLHVNNLVPVPIDLSKVSKVSSKNDVVKKDVCNNKIKDIEVKIPDITNLATNTTLNAKINEVKNEIPSITNVTTTAAFNAKINEVKNKIPNITNLATNTALTTPEFNKLTAEYFTARLKQANLASKNDIAALAEETGFDDKLKKSNKKITSSKTKHVLAENESKKLRTFNSSLFISKSHFNNDGAQLSSTTLKRLGDTGKVVSSKSKGLSTPTITDNSLSPSIKWYENINLCLVLVRKRLKTKTHNFYST